MSDTSLRDPVCGMPVDPRVALRATFEGQEYSFCSALCRDSFIAHPQSLLPRRPTSVNGGQSARRMAYFTMEIALDPGMPTYSGGLGVLAGDTIRACADLGVPLVAITLLHRDGYVRQSLDAGGWQHDDSQPWNPSDFLEPLGETVDVTIEGRSVRVRAWRREVRGESAEVVPVLFLDTDLPDNTPADRSLTGRLYGNDERYRFCQEVVLGVGGLRILNALGFTEIERYHLNEGHAALAPLELLRQLNASREQNDWEFSGTRQRCIFTTHTPVAAGHDKFPWALVESVLGPLVPRRIFEMVGGSESLNMTALALNLCGYVNGVARKHAEVSRAMFPGYGIHHITNGIHSRTWTAAPFARLFDRHLPGWSADPFLLRNAVSLPQDEVWRAHIETKRTLVETVHRLSGRLLDPTAFTIGFARRATEYKRADLIFMDLERLREIARKVGPLQLVFAGKAHPRDTPGKELIKRIFGVARALGDDVPVVYLPEYEMDLARTMVSGVDVWLNTPQRPLEASGTSGMKAAHNGVPSLSVLDGWWLEGCVEGVTGWAIGEAVPISDAAEVRRREAEDLYAKLESVVAPSFYADHDRWLGIMKHTIALNASFFNTHRMVQQYAVNAYL